MAQWISAVLLFLLVLGPILGADILVVHPFHTYSHTVPFKPIFKELARRGHNITIITPYTEEPAPEGFNQIKFVMDLEKLKEDFGNTMDPKGAFNGWTYQVGGMWPACNIMTPTMNRDLKRVLPAKRENFDLLVIEPFFCQESILGLSHYYNAPVVATLPQSVTPAIATALGNPDLPSYIPNIRLEMTPDMSFSERLYNTWISLTERIGSHFYYLPFQDEQMRKLLDDSPDLPYLGDLYNNISLLLTLTHFSLSYPRPVMKNILEVGGLSLDIKQPLTQDLEKFLNESSDGVVYFSWGSHYEDTDSEHTLPVLMDIFSQLKQRVVFKWHDTNITNKLDNVLVSKWVPQTALLNHKNVKLFISHCGLNSIYEAAYYGVPVVGMPLFGDQLHNSRILEYHGMGVTVQYDQVKDGETLLAAINRVLDDSSFRANAEKRGRMLKERVLPIEEEAAYWIEYVIKHGSDALKPPSISMPWYRLALVDVYACIFALVLLPILGVALCINICRRKRNSRAVDVNKKKK